LRERKSPSKEVLMEMLSAEYGWLPSDIKRQSADDIRNYVKILDVKRRIQKAETDKLKYGRK